MNPNGAPNIQPVYSQSPAPLPPPPPVYNSAPPSYNAYKDSSYNQISSGAGVISLSAGLLAVLVKVIFDFTNVSSWEAIYIPIFVVALAGLVFGIMGLKKIGTPSLMLILGLVFSGVMAVISINSIAQSIHLNQATSGAQQQAQQYDQKLQQQLQSLQSQSNSSINGL